MYDTINDGKIMEKIVDKFLWFIRWKETKLKVSKEDPTVYVISYGKYKLSIINNSKAIGRMNLQFDYNDKGLCWYIFTITENERLYSKLAYRLLQYCDGKMLRAKKMEVIQEFLDNN